MNDAIHQYNKFFFQIPLWSLNSLIAMPNKMPINPFGSKMNQLNFNKQENKFIPHYNHLV